MRELAIASLIGMAGAAALAFGIQGYLDPEHALLAPFADPTTAAVAMGVGLLCCLIEVRLMLPALRGLSRKPPQA